MPTARGVPKRSPIQVLTTPVRIWLLGSDETRYASEGMVVGECGWSEYVDGGIIVKLKCRIFVIVHIFVPVDGDDMYILVHKFILWSFYVEWAVIIKSASHQCYLLGYFAYSMRDSE